MFNRLKDRAKITDQDPTFKVRYIGSIETFKASGKGCTNLPVQRLWDNAEDEHRLPRVQIKLTVTGIHMKNLEKKKIPLKTFSIENISFCNVDSSVNDRIFSWIYKDCDGSPLECHAVICSNTEKAKAMALVLSRAFQIAYKEWKSNQMRTEREIEKHRRSSTIAQRSLQRENTHDSSPTLVTQRDGILEAETSFSVKSSVSSDNGQTSGSINGGSDSNGSVASSHNSDTNGSKSRDMAIQAEM